MSNEKVQSFIKMVVEENLVQAQTTLKSYLNEKLTEVLNEKFEEYAPTLFEGKAKPDFLDLDGDGNTEEPMKQAARQAKEGDSEDVETDEEQSDSEEEEDTQDEEADEECEDCEAEEEEED